MSPQNPFDLLAFSVYDSKAESYINPFFLPMQAMAVREFQNCVNDPQHQFGRNPADYTLFRIGTWSSESGSFTETDTLAIGNGVEFLHNANVEQFPDGPVRDETSIQPSAAG